MPSDDPRVLPGEHRVEPRWAQPVTGVPPDVYREARKATKAVRRLNEKLRKAHDRDLDSVHALGYHRGVAAATPLPEIVIPAALEEYAAELKTMAPREDGWYSLAPETREGLLAALRDIVATRGGR